MRVLGFLTGAALVIGAMVVVLGSPELRDETSLANVEVMTERLDLPAVVEPVVTPAAPVAEPPHLWAVVAGVSDYRGDAIDVGKVARC